MKDENDKVSLVITHITYIAIQYSYSSLVYWLHLYARLVSIAVITFTKMYKVAEAEVKYPLIHRCLFFCPNRSGMNFKCADIQENRQCLNKNPTTGASIFWYNNVCLIESQRFNTCGHLFNFFQQKNVAFFHFREPPMNMNSEAKKQ